MDDATPQLVSIEQVSDGWVKKYLLRYTLPSGLEHCYEVASRKGLAAFRAGLLRPEGEKGRPRADAVCVVGKTADDAVIMVREFRYSLNSWCIAFPAGLIDPSEDMYAAADRELREETGFRIAAGSAVHVLPQAGFSSTGMTDEAVQILFAHVERAEKAHPEPSELIAPFELPCTDIAAFLAGNQLPLGTRTQLLLGMLAGGADPLSLLSTNSSKHSASMQAHVR